MSMHTREETASSILVDSRTTHVINAPEKSVDLSRWIFSLTDKAYQACSSAHIAGGISQTGDGKRMSINVERISGNLLVQHYVEEIAERHHVRVNSVSDSFTEAGATQLGVTWELTTKPITERSCELSNRVIIRSTPAFLESLARGGIADLEP